MTVSAIVTTMPNDVFSRAHCEIIEIPIRPVAQSVNTTPARIGRRNFSRGMRQATK